VPGLGARRSGTPTTVMRTRMSVGQTDGRTGANACSLSLHYSTQHYVSNIQLVFNLTNNCIRPVVSAP
jgi:hypothetical protein